MKDIIIQKKFSKEEIKFIKENYTGEKDNVINIAKQLNRSKTAECEELKKKNVILQNRNQQLDGATTEASRYRKALEEIAAEAMSIKLFNFGYDELGIEEEIVEYADNILDIISKVKEKE